MRRRRLLALLLVGVLGGCAFRTPLPTYQTNPDASAAGVLVDGRLEMAPIAPCLAVKAIGDPLIALAWPSGYTVTFAPIQVYDPSGTVVAKEGVDLSFGGSMIQQRNLACGTESTLLVSEVHQPTNDAK
jgi:hypothetical protein